MNLTLGQLWGITTLGHGIGNLEVGLMEEADSSDHIVSFTGELYIKDVDGNTLGYFVEVAEEGWTFVPAEEEGS